MFGVVWGIDIEVRFQVEEPIESVKLSLSHGLLASSDLGEMEAPEDAFFHL